MKMFWKELLLCAFMGLVLPGALMEVSSSLLPRKEAAQAAAETTQETVAVFEEAPLSCGTKLPVLWPDGSTRQVDLEEYLVGVVLAEMPASFEAEALKAQSVAARTYAGKIHNAGEKHGNGSVCTNSQCCQAYISPDDYLDKGGSPQAVEKVRNAVLATAGEVLTYEEELIEATYFSCSGGSTEDAKAVWGADFPYLRSVSSPGEEGAAYYRDRVNFSKEMLEMKLGVKLETDPDTWLGPVTRTQGDGVKTIEIGGKTFRGTQLRQLLGLRSTSFTATTGGHGLTIETKGYGHRVGMSQYGADAMAVSGKTYREILSYYYQGTELSQYIDTSVPEGAEEVTIPKPTEKDIA